MLARGTFRGGARGRGRGRGRGGRGGNSSSDSTNWRDETSSNQSNGESVSTALVSLTEMSIANAKEKRKERVFVHPTEMVTFIVGEDDNVQKFSVHKEFACRNSPVLDRAFNSEFIEGQTQTYTLEDNTPAAFRFFVQFLYQEKMTLDYHNEDPSDDLDHGRYGDEYFLKCLKQEQDLVQLWILAEKFLIPKLQDQILDHLYRLRLACGPVTRPICNYVYSNTEPGSQLKKFVVDSWAWHLSAQILKQVGDQLPREMLLDLAVGYLEAAPQHVVVRKQYALKSSDFHVSKESQAQ